MTKEVRELLKARKAEHATQYEEYVADGLTEAAYRSLAKEVTDSEILRMLEDSGDEAKELANLIDAAAETWKRKDKSDDELAAWLSASWAEVVEVAELCYHYDIVSGQRL